jgi:hypothetical protein
MQTKESIKEQNKRPQSWPHQREEKVLRLFSHALHANFPFRFCGFCTFWAPMGLFTFVCGVFAFIVAASFALSSTDPKPLSIEVLAWKEQGRIVKGWHAVAFISFISFFFFLFPSLFVPKGPAGQNVFVVDLAGRNVNGSTLVIGHGFPTSSFEWREMIPRLIPHFARVVVFDYVGFGLSDKPVLDAGVYSVADHADTLLFVLEMTRSKDLELLCHDMSDSVCSEALSRGLKGELLWLRIWVACVCVCFFFLFVCFFISVSKFAELRF